MNEREIFIEALQRPNEEKRTAFLNEACGHDAELLERVNALLNDEPESFLERPAFKIDETSDSGGVRQDVGTTVGPYKLMEQIGEGGFGLVFVAEQREPVRRLVALKLIKPGMDSVEVIARFEAERQALALMDHPNIARVLDAGTTDTGLPYFVMDLVRGIPITTFCDENQLSPRKRLKLFLPICRAVQHAHQKGIIHRDLKPSNILVTLHDGHPVPKVIDFGVAKALNQQLTQRTIYTRFSQMIGTPLYMSPEQAEMSGLDVDTRSDIYSLGVLLYELLTGSTPFDRKQLSEAAFDEVRRIIREEEPPKPSTRLSQSGERLRGLAAQRKTEPAKLSRMIRGDLDWIVMKALEKDRQRRYETANGLAMDIRRYLDNEAVVARPPSTLYLLSKLARRNKAAFAATFAVFLALLVGLALATWGFSEAKLQASIAQTESEAAKAHSRAAERSGKLAEQANERLSRQIYLGHLAAADKALLRNDYRRAQKELTICSLNQRGWEWHFLWERFSSTFTPIQCSGPPNFTPDGKRLVAIGPWANESMETSFQSVDDSNTVPARSQVHIWELPSSGPPELVGVLAHGKELTFSVLSPDANTIAAGDSEGHVIAWDMKSQEKLWTVKGHDKKLDGMAFSSDGQSVATVAWDNTLKVFDAGSGNERFALALKQTDPEGKSNLREVTFSANDRWIATAFHGKESILVDATSGLEVTRFPGKEHMLPTFGPNGQVIATGNVNGSITIWKWDGMRLEPVRTWQADKAAVWALKFSADGTRLASGHRRSSVKVWNSNTGVELASFRSRDYARNLAFHPTSEQIAFYSVADGVEFRRYRRPAEGFEMKLQQSPVSPVTFSPNGRMIAVGADDPAFFGQSVNKYYDDGGIVWEKTDNVERPLIIIDAKTGKTLHAVQGALDGISWTSDSRCVLVSAEVNSPPESEFTIQMLDASTGVSVSSFVGHSGRALPFLARSGKQMTSIGQDGSIRTWEVGSGQCTTSSAARPGLRISGASVSPRGNRVAVAFYWQWKIEIQDTQTRKDHFINVPGQYVRQLVFTEDENGIYAGSNGGKLELYDIQTQERLKSFVGHRGQLWAIAISPDEAQVVAGDSSGQVIVWDVESSQPLVTLTDGNVGASALDWSPDGKQIVAGKVDGTVHIWTLPSVPKKKESQFP